MEMHVSMNYEYAFQREVVFMYLRFVVCLIVIVLFLFEFGKKAYALVSFVMHCFVRAHCLRKCQLFIALYTINLC